MLVLANVKNQLIKPFESPASKPAVPVTLKKTPLKGRKVLPFGENVGPSEGGETVSPTKKVKDERVTQLGATRLLQAAAEAHVQKHLGSSPFRRATVAQTGQSKQYGKHAAHAGIICHMGDSVKSRIVGRIIHMGLQENDEDILRAKGADDDDIELLKQSDLNKKDVDTVVQSFWQRQSLLGGSPLELQALNTTYQVDRVINLCVDKRVEAEFRPKVIAWTRDVVKGEMTELNMIKLYANELNTFLHQCESESKTRLASLNVYEQCKLQAVVLAKGIITNNSIDLADIKALVLVVNKWRRAKDALQNKSQGAPKVSLPSYSHFQQLLQLPRILKQKTDAGKSTQAILDYTMKVVLKLNKKGFDVGVIEEFKFAKQQSKLERMIRGFNLEREGTVFTDADYLNMFGKYDEDSNTRVPLDEIENRQLALDMVRTPRVVRKSLTI